VTDIIISNDYVTLVYEPDLKTIYHTFHQHISGQVFYEALDAGLQALEYHGARKWLSDDRQNTGIDPEDMEWAMFDWGPRAAAAGWKYWALVVPENFQGRVDMSSIVQKYYDLGVEIRVFISLEEAERWLSQI